MATKKPNGPVFTDKNGNTLICESDNCRNPRPKGAAYCEKCRKEMMSDHSKGRWGA